MPPIARSDRRRPRTSSRIGWRCGRGMPPIPAREARGRPQPAPRLRAAAVAGGRVSRPSHRPDAGDQLWAPLHGASDRCRVRPLPPTCAVSAPPQELSSCSFRTSPWLRPFFAFVPGCRRRSARFERTLRGEREIGSVKGDTATRARPHSGRELSSVTGRRLSGSPRGTPPGVPSPPRAGGDRRRSRCGSDPRRRVRRRPRGRGPPWPRAALR